jgi:cation diffusion facilitator CzcD-associated flavoprotein CzcO
MPDTVLWPTQPETITDILIIGTGFAGLAMAIRLRQAGFTDFLLIEKAGDVGGTWRDNQYPGCACDIPSHLYSLSFEPKADWSRMYPQQPEIQDYLKGVAEKHKLREKIRFNTVFTEARWDEAGTVWHITTSTGRITARVLVSAIGALHIPATPALKGLETFAGQKFHSAAWDFGVDLAAKRVAVIGTGASAIQFVPQIAPVVEKLHVFQRTPAWIVPKPDRAFSARETKWLKLPLYRRCFRAFLFWLHELRVLAFLGNKRAQKLSHKMAVNHIHQHIKDPALRAKLTPLYAVGCKRVMISNDFYPALNRSNVDLVTNRIAEIRPHSIVDEAGVERDIDVLIFGTGFEVTSAYKHVRLLGVGGRDLGAEWDRAGMMAYKGIAVSGFPNYFMLLGPNTGLGHNSVVIMIEAQVQYVIGALTQMRARQVRAVDVRQSVQDADQDVIATRLAGTVWQDGGCDSWYKDEHGRVSAIWPGSAASYQRAVKTANLQDYRVLGRQAAQITA